MNSNIAKIVIGASGIGASEVASSISFFDPDSISTTGNILVQIVILLSTLFGLFKRKKR